MRFSDALTQPAPTIIKLSELIQIGLTDLERCEADPLYGINMRVWHVWASLSGDAKWRCFVCMGGAIMAKSLQVPLYVDWHPVKDFDGPIRPILLAVDCLRVGSVTAAADYLGVSVNPWDFDRSIGDYEHSAEVFKQDLRQLATDLADAGL